MLRSLSGFLPCNSGRVGVSAWISVTNRVSVPGGHHRRCGQGVDER
jgi:hypothetical protein